MNRMIATACLYVTALGAVSADDWPQWMGRDRDGVWHETGLISSFPESGPNISWTVEAGLGYAGPAYADGSVFLFDYVVSDGSINNNPGQRGTLEGEERLRRIDGRTGDEIWSTSYDAAYSVSYPSGPRCTPTVHGDRIVTLGAMGHLTCFSAETGEQLWQVDIPTKFGASIPIWGFASHPLVHTAGDKTLVITMIGGSEQAVGAFDLADGGVVWKGRSSRDAGYAPANVIEVNNSEQIIMFSPSEVAGLDPATGEAIWNVEVEPDYGMSINSPRLAGDRLVVTSYGKTLAATFGANSSTPTVEWDDPGPRSLFTANSRPFVDQGLAFGCDINSGLFRAIQLTDGSPVWQTKEPVAPAGHDGRWRTRHATAFITKIVGEDRFVLFNDLGELVFCTLDAEGYVETGRGKVVEPTGEAFGRSVVWSYPAYADRAAFVRNDEVLVRVNLAK